MSNVLVEESSLQAIADTIRSKLGVADTYKPSEMADAIDDIGGGSTPTGTKQINISANGTTTEDVTNYASARITVAVPGASLGTKSITENGTYSASSDSLDGYSSVTVNVSGGGGEEADWNDVCFWDYDGRCLYSYTAAEFAALNALPSNPSHSGLTAQGWNWSLADAKTFVAANGFLDIGQLYVTSDDKTHIKVEMTESKFVSIKLTGSAVGNVTIDWGDSSPTETNTGTSSTTYTHTYTDYGNYDITIARSSGTVTFNDRLKADDMGVFREINVGSGVVLGSTCFSYTMSLKGISIPSDCNVSHFNPVTGARCIILPSDFLTNSETIQNSMLEIICFAKQNPVNSVSYKFGNCRKLKRVSASCVASGGSMGNQYLIDCNSLQRFIITDGVTALSSSNATTRLWSLQKITFPDSVTSINNFSDTYSLREVHMKATTPPTLSSTSIFSNRPQGFTIYVPRSENQTVLNAYKTATNWSSYASSIQEEPA